MVNLYMYQFVYTYVSDMLKLKVLPIADAKYTILCSYILISKHEKFSLLVSLWMLLVVTLRLG